MIPFRNPEAAEMALDRVQKLVSLPFKDAIRTALGEASNPDLALMNFERWLSAVSGADSFAAQIVDAPPLAGVLMRTLGAGHQLGDMLVQNPEFAGVLLDPSTIMEPIETNRLVSEGVRLLSASNSYAHSLDRLRFLKQKTTLKIAALDLSGFSSGPEIWRALSDCADALILLAKEVAWKDYAEMRGLDGYCPVEIIGMGKLGGQELNYSSDIDLIFITPDDIAEDFEKHATRFCEKFIRALMDRMGRGSAYRVDMRLRPYGRSGPIVSTMRALEAYFDKHAEPWEHMALIRSRPIEPNTEIGRRWASMREKISFGKPRSSMSIDSILGMRQRIEERSGPDDVKRFSGGIRDVEFTCQILQLLFGRMLPSLRGVATLDVLTKLREADIISDQALKEMSEGYTFLRQTEHQCQIVSDLQTHSLPQNPDERLFLSRRLGFKNTQEFESVLELHRSRIRHWHQELVPATEEPAMPGRAEALNRFESGQSGVAAWFDGIAESSSFYESLLANESSVERVEQIVHRAPALIPVLRESVVVTEQIVSGEILEEFAPGPHKLGGELQAQGRTLRRRWARCASKSALVVEFDFGSAWSDVIDEAIDEVNEGRHFSVIALGGLGGRELALHSDADLFFVAHDDQAESAAQKLVQKFQELRNWGSPLVIDLRLRPEGKKGRITATEDALIKYRQERLEPWERFAISRSRLVSGVPESMQLLRRHILDGGLSIEEFESLLNMKTRIEKERVPVIHPENHIKLGPGGLDDILWSVHLRLLLEPESRPDVPSVANLADKEMLAAWNQFQRIRLQLGMLGWKDDRLPEEPEKMDVLADILGFGSSSELKSHLEQVQKSVRSQWLDLKTDLKKSCWKSPST